MTVDDAVDFFAAIPKIARRCSGKGRGLQVCDFGTTSNSLSGGEAQRMELAQ